MGKSSWIIDGSTRYLTTKGGIWSNWVAGDLLDVPKVPGTHAVQMPSRGNMRAWRRIELWDLQTLGQKQLDHRRKNLVREDNARHLVKLSRQRFAGYPEVTGAHAVHMTSRRSMEAWRQIKPGGLDPLD